VQAQVQAWGLEAGLQNIVAQEVELQPVLVATVPSSLASSPADCSAGRRQIQRKVVEQVLLRPFLKAPGVRDALAQDQNHLPLPFVRLADSLIGSGFCFAVHLVGFDRRCLDYAVELDSGSCAASVL